MRDIFEYRDNFKKYSEIESKLLVGDVSLIPDPIVSVVMPIFNRPQYLKTALQSVIEQTFKGNYEIIIVDNNDTVAGKNANQLVIESINSDKVLYYRNEKNIGMLGNWNRCIELARAPYVVFCHDDDMLLPDALRILMDLKSKNPDKAIFGARNVINTNGDLISRCYFPATKKFGLFKYRNAYGFMKEDVFVSSPGFGCGCLFDKKHLIDIGGYDSEFYPSSDYALNALYVFKYGGVFSCIPTFNYRIAENESLNVYEKFVEVDKHFRECMSNHMKWPNFILKRIIIANYRISKIHFAITWGKKEPTLINQLKFSDKLVMKLVSIKLALRQWSF